ncbi:hypothetical protein CERSUDRAFT_116606 [Gelatoporia subvermispora B]|uniref:Uncharacterized protein n=1 Tax=Ceriporiopsis subvermispora (strain B) TaxID=914234 RepID=M2R8S7_CERS8|nr:hypothetical protein CERSUDRAFT_116606 [Gelatoporia subvermispora B]
MTDTNDLPPPTFKYVHTTAASVEIDAPVEKVWDVLMDVGKYTEWNPFTRAVYVVDAARNVLPEQVPEPGGYVLLTVNIPPTLAATQRPHSMQLERVLQIDADGTTKRIAWGPATLPRWLIRAERWQIVRPREGGGAVYETREGFGGLGAGLCGFSMRRGCRRDSTRWLGRSRRGQRDCSGRGRERDGRRTTVHCGPQLRGLWTAGCPGCSRLFHTYDAYD